MSREEQLMKIPGVVGVGRDERNEIVIYMNGSHECSGYSCQGFTHVHATDRKGGVDTLDTKVSLETPVSVYRERWRPVPGGVSGAYSVEGEEKIGGTIGAVLEKGGDTYFLSNAHVFGYRNDVPITQPSPKDGGLPEDEVGVVYQTSKIDFTRYNEIDASIAKTEVGVSDNILDNGVILGMRQARYFQKVEKTGRDGYTSGRILSLGGKFKVNYEIGGEDKVAHFKDLIVTTAMASPGDSGSVLVKDEGGYKYALGLLFAGSDYVTLYIPIQKVMDYFGTKFVGA